MVSKKQMRIAIRVEKKALAVIQKLASLRMVQFASK
jgi:hypothetical protein